MEGSISKPSEKRVALVTGGNRGMGFEICRQLASSGLTVVLTARNEKRGVEAVDKLRGLGLPDVVFHQLEITEPDSAVRLADFVKSKFGKLDILVNNAAIFGVTMDVGDPAALKEMLAGKDQNEIAKWLRQRTTQSTQEAEDCVKINYHGTKNVTEALLPLVQSSSDGRITNVTSAFGLLRFFSGEELKQELSSIDTLTKQRLDELPALFLEDFKSGELEPRGWPTDRVYSAYQVSKALVCAYTRILARENAALRVNCVQGRSFIVAKVGRGPPWLNKFSALYNIISAQSSHFLESSSCYGPVRVFGPCWNSAQAPSLTACTRDTSRPR